MRLVSTLLLVLLVAVISSANDVVERSEIEEVEDDQPNQERRKDMKEEVDDKNQEVTGNKITVTLIDKENNKEYKITCDENYPTISLRSMFGTASGLATSGLSSRRILMFKNKQLPLTDTLKQSGICDGDSIDVVLKTQLQEKKEKMERQALLKSANKQSNSISPDKSTMEEDEDVTGKEIEVTLVDKRDGEEYDVKCNEEDLIITLRNIYKNFLLLPATGLYSRPILMYKKKELGPHQTLKQCEVPDGAYIDVYPNPVPEEKKGKKKIFSIFKSSTKGGKKFSSKDSKIEEKEVDQPEEEREGEDNQPEKERQEENDQPEKESQEEDDQPEEEMEEEEHQAEKEREEEMNNVRDDSAQAPISVILVDKENNKEYKVTCDENASVMRLRTLFTEASGLSTFGRFSRRTLMYKHNSRYIQLHPFKTLKQYGVTDGATIEFYPTGEIKEDSKMKKFKRFFSKGSKKLSIKKKSKAH